MKSHKSCDNYMIDFELYEVELGFKEQVPLTFCHRGLNGDLNDCEDTTPHPGRMEGSCM